MVCHAHDRSGHGGFLRFHLLADSRLQPMAATSDGAPPPPNRTVRPCGKVEGHDMLSTATLTAFLASADPTRATGFYRDTLGLRLVSDDRFAVVFDCHGVQLRIQKVEKLQPHPFTALGWVVASIRRGAAALAKRGVTFERYAFLEQDDLGVWQAPSGAKVAWFKDPDGNLLSLTESSLPKKRLQPAKARRPNATRRASG
jgi:catechol 2,3-dioxygenase-like lactoylglutathione lyase family enzyme